MNASSTSDCLDNINLFLNQDDEASIKLGVMAAKISFYNFQWLYTSLIIFLSASSAGAVDVFLSRYNKSVAIKLGKFRPLHIGNIHQYVIFGDESSEIMEYLNWLVEMNFDNTGKYLLICYSMEFRNCNETSIFKGLEKNYICNAIFLRIGYNNEPTSFTYQPILPGICKNNKPERLNITNDCINDSCFKLVYPEKLNNLQGCPIIVSTFEQPPFMYLHNGASEPTGGDAEMLKTVTSALNATLIIKTPADDNDWGHYVDKNWTGSMGDVFNDRAHLSVCSLPLTSHKYGNFQVSFIYNTMDIVWVAKLPSLKSPWQKIIRPFNIRARISVLVTFIIITILGGFIRSRTWRKTSKLLNIGNTKQSVFFYSWIIFLGVPLLKVPSKRALLIIVYAWIWFCLVMRSSYQGALIKSLKKDVYRPNYESFHDVPQTKFAYGGQASYREYFVDDKQIYDNWTLLDLKSAHDMLHRISNGTSSFVLASNKELVIEHLLHHNGTRQLQIIPQKIINSPTVMYMRKYSPLAAPLNIMLSRAMEAGYAQAWHMRFARQRKVLFQHSKNKDLEAMNLENFRGCIMVTVTGWVASLLFFIIEVYCGRINEYND